MTTKVTVDAHAGWPVRVRQIEKGNIRSEQIVDPGKTQDFSIWDGMDIEVHEVQPNEKDLNS